MTGLFDTRDSDNLARRNIAPGPPATHGETLQSISDDVSANIFSNAQHLVLFNEYDRYLDEIEAATGQSFDNPYGLAERPEHFIIPEPNPALARYRERALLGEPGRRLRPKTRAEREAELLAEVTRLRDE